MTPWYIWVGYAVCSAALLAILARAGYKAYREAGGQR